MICVATDFAMVGFDIISDPDRREEIRTRLTEMGRRVIALDNHQINEFAGNATEPPAPSIESIGGSVRCMLAGIHLARRY